MISTNLVPPWFGLPVGAVILVFAGVTGRQALRAALLAKSAKAWPTVPGRVEHSQIRERIGAKGRRYYLAAADYSYRVAGTDYRGAVINPMYGQSASRGEAEELLAKLRSGTAVQVSCDPLHPEKSMLAPGFLLSAAGGMMFSGMIFLVGLYLIAGAALSYQGRGELVSRIIRP
jgi:hypothetical protein